jgi:H+/Cl- antiporter ClcA
MSKEISTNNIRKSVLLTTIFATVFIIIILILFYEPALVNEGIKQNIRENSGFNPQLIIIEAFILIFLALLGTLLVILKNRKS